MIKDVNRALSDMRALLLDANQLYCAVFAALGTDADARVYMQDYWSGYDTTLDGPPTRRQILQHAFDAVGKRNDPVPHAFSAIR